jgi:hypothetical protein
MSTPQRAYQICVRCVMDTSDPWIRFNRLGACHHCSDFLANRVAVTAYHKHQTPQTDNGLQALFQDILNSRTSETKHDVIVGVSGGVDSSSVALLAQQAGLRVLAVHMDNGWDTPIAIQNIFKLVGIEGISYHAEVLHWNSFKVIQRAFIEAGVPDIELPTDIAIQASLHRVAQQRDVRTILSGGNIANEGILPPAWLYNARDSRYAHAVLRQAGVPARLYQPLNFGFRRELRARLVHRIRTLYPLNHFRYDKEAARINLQQTFGWQSYGGKHCESTFTRFTQLVYLPRRHGIDYRRGYLSADICLGKITRAEALQMLQTPPWSDINGDQDLAFVARKLDYTPTALAATLQAPPRWYSDFPNRERLLGVAYNSYRLLTGRPKASNF